jgi:hypothetical protein
MEPVRKSAAHSLSDMVKHLEAALDLGREISDPRNIQEVEQLKIDRIQQSLEAMIKDAKRIEHAIYRRARR